MNTTISFAKLLLVASLAASVVACGGDDAVGKGPEPTPTPTGSTAPPPPPVTPARTLVEGSLVPSSTQNLLLDPGFQLTEDGGQIAGAFIAMFEQSQGALTLKVRVDSTSPAGFGGGVAVAREPRATDERARSIQFLAAFTGGKGPFVAKVWVASTDAAGAPRAFPEDGGGFEASLLDPTTNRAADLKRNPERTKAAGGRTWVLYEGTFAQTLVGGGIMIMTTGTKGGGFELAAPEIVATSSTNGLVRSAPMAVRPMRESERAAATAYGKIPKKLVPPKGNPAPRPALPTPKR